MKNKFELSLAVIGCALAFGLTCFFYANSVHFKYVTTGPYLMDTGWFNYLVGPDSRFLTGPRTLGGESFFIVHMSPLLFVFHWLSQILHLHDQQPLEMTLGFGFGAAAAASFLVARQFLRPLGAIGAALLALAFAVAFSISGIMQSIAGYPHIEILYVGLAAMALLCIFQRRKRWAWGFLIACMMVREDAGLHIACILGAYLVLAAIQERGLPERARDLTPFLLATVGGSVLTIMAQRAFFPSASTFEAIYSGHPAYAHLTGALVQHRLQMMLNERLYVTLTLATTLAVMVFKFRFVALTAVLASIPWLLLNMTANSSAAGELSVYYPFPFLVLALAPFIVCADLPDPKPVYVDHL